MRITDGLKLIAGGLIKKAVIADRIAPYVDQVYNNPRAYGGLSLCSATLFFAFQIHCDFSGYSDIAIGTAQVLGVRLITNFRRPYASRSTGEFWTRWHISLSSWFRDYMYIPLGGNRVPVPRWFFNISVTFLISGLWHGANWTFVAWGALNGLYVVVGIATVAPRRRLLAASGLSRAPAIVHAAQVAITFLLVTVSWILFVRRRWVTRRTSSRTSCPLPATTVPLWPPTRMAGSCCP